MKSLILIIGIIFCFNQVFADTFNYRNFTIEDGLPSSQVYNMTQDQNGYLWFATDRGICKYDGYEFKTFDIEDGLPDNVVLRLYPQNNGEIWGTTINGELFHFDPLNAIIKNYKYNSKLKKRLKKHIINSFYFDQGTIYLSFKNGNGFIKIDSRGMISNFYNPFNIQDSLLYTVQVRKTIDQEHVYSFNFTTYSEIDFLNTEFKAFNTTKQILNNGGSNIRSARKKNKTVVISDQNILFQHLDTSWKKSPINIPISVGFYNDHQIWVGYKNHGIEVYSFNGILVHSFLKGKSVTDLYRDHAGGMWITTLSSGIFYVQNPTYIRKSFVYGKDNQIKNIISTLKNEIYLGYNNGLTLKYNKFKKKTIAPLKLTNKLSSLMGYNPYFEKTLHLFHGGLYLGFQNRICDKTALIHFKLGGGRLKIADDYVRKEFLISTRHNFIEVDEQLNIKIHPTRFAILDVIRSPNGFYLATASGIYKYSENEEIEWLMGKDPFFSLHTVDINKGKDYYYAGTKGGGLTVFNNDTSFSIQKSNGLYNNNINKLYTQNDSTLWVCSNTGLNRIKFKSNGSYKITGINQSDGLLYNDIKDVTIVKDTLWIVTGKGVNTVPLSVFEQNKIDTLFLTIQSFTINDTVLGSIFHNELAHDQNQLNIKYQAISFKNKKLKYRYRLIGLDKNWIYTNSRNVRYPSLNPGKYSFVIQVSNGDWNNYTEEQTVLIVIHPPFYDTWWFKVLLITFFTLIVYFFFRMRILKYNKVVIKEILRYFLRRVKKEEKYIVIKEQGKNVKVITSTILYVKSANNNIEIFTTKGVHVTRLKLSDFIVLAPDPLEFLRIHRSHIVRLDKIEQYDRKNVIIGKQQIPVSGQYQAKYIEILF